jgi:predicted nucleic acid-binding protein
MVDTNVLVYCVDEDSPQKRKIALELVEGFLVQSRLILSVQVLNEFYVATTRRTRVSPMAPADARRIVERYARACEITPLTPSTTLLALDAVNKHSLSFWDALVWAAAKEHGITELFSEDFQNGRELEGVRFVNPFVAP